MYVVRRTLLLGMPLAGGVILSGCGRRSSPQLSDAEEAIKSAPKVTDAEVMKAGGNYRNMIACNIWTTAESEELPEVCEEAWGRGVRVLYEIYREDDPSIGGVLAFGTDGSEFNAHGLLADPPLNYGLDQYYEHYDIP